MDNMRSIEITYKSGKKETLVYNDENMSKIKKKLASPDYESWVLSYNKTEIMNSKK